MGDAFVILVAEMRSAQRELQGNYTRKQLDIVGRLEAQVDEYVARSQREAEQMDFWSRGSKHSEVAGPYNVVDDQEIER